jgi:integron integrase
MLLRRGGLEGVRTHPAMVSPRIEGERASGQRARWRAMERGMTTGAGAEARPKLLDAVRQACRARQFSDRTAATYSGWVRRFVRFHGTRHPRELDGDAIQAFLAHLADQRRVSVSTQRQAASALLFLYNEVLKIPVELPAGVLRPVRPRRLPTVLSRTEVAALLAEVRGTPRLVASLLYGAGLRVMEGLELRVKDVAIERGEIRVRSGKGGHDRITMVPRALRSDLRRQVERVRTRHADDLGEGAGWVPIPGALARKIPSAGRDLAWQYLFPASRLYLDPRTGRRQRLHLHPSAVQREVSAAGRRAGIPKRVTCHTLRHSFATHLLDDGYDIRTIQELLGHRSVKTTMIYTHVLNRGPGGVISPLDRLD